MATSRAAESSLLEAESQGTGAPISLSRNGHIVNREWLEQARYVECRGPQLLNQTPPSTLAPFLLDLGGKKWNNAQKGSEMMRKLNLFSCQ